MMTATHVNQATASKTAIVQYNTLHWCKNQSFPELPHTARSVTDKEDEKTGKIACEKICSSGNAKIHISLKGIA